MADLEGLDPKSHRLIGLSYSPINFSYHLAVAAPIAQGLMLWVVSRENLGRRRMVLYWVGSLAVLLLLATAVVYSGTRSCWLALVLTAPMGLIPLWRMRARRLTVSLGLAAIIASVLLIIVLPLALSSDSRKGRAGTRLASTRVCSGWTTLRAGPECTSLKAALRYSQDHPYGTIEYTPDDSHYMTMNHEAGSLRE